MLTYEEVTELLEYRPDVGGSCLVWKKKAAKNTIIGSRAGCWDGSSYGRWFVRIRKKLYRAHRVVWLLNTGNWPTNQIDHIDGNPYNNAIANLRECNQSENNQNMVSHKNATSEHIGVCFDRTRKKWMASIAVYGKNKYLGRFDNEQDAIKAYREAKAQLHAFNPVPR